MTDERLAVTATLSSTSDLTSNSRRSEVQRAEEASLIMVACLDAHKYEYKLRHFLSPVFIT